MNHLEVAVEPIRFYDLLAVTRMTHANMTGIDQAFTRMTSRRIARWFSYLMLPFYFWFAGHGYKALYQKRIVGCAYLHLYSHSAYIFNVSVNKPYRHSGVGRTLMAHLEKVARAERMRWAALQVDRDNDAAQQLYLQLGYRKVHSRFYRWHPGNELGSHAASQPHLARVSQSRGEQIYRTYKRLERKSGDAWAAAVAGFYDRAEAKPVVYSSCSVDGTEVGCLRQTGPAEKPVLKLLLLPDYWGHDLEKEIIAEVGQRLLPYAEAAEFHFGSSTHHESIGPYLARLGLQEQSVERILMLKPLDKRT